MPQCFVMQPFDNGGPFDRRYKEVISIAIERAGYTPYRVDNDPSVTIPIHAIEEQIRASAACVADVTQRNPNVWFELGFALAAGKDVVLICEEGAYQHYPFDIQHRRIISYTTSSISDLQLLSRQVRERLQAINQSQENRDALSSLPALKPTDGLASHEVAALAIIAEHGILPESDAVSEYWLKREMESAGYTGIAASIAVHRLIRRGFVRAGKLYDRSANEDYTGFLLQDAGIDWLAENESKLTLRLPSQPISFDDNTPAF